MSISSKRRNPDNLESHSSIKPMFTNIWGFCSNLVECESFIELSSPEILDLCERKLDDSNDCSYRLLIWKDSVVHIHAPAVFVKLPLPVAGGLSLGNFASFIQVFVWLYFIPFLPSFSSIDHLVRIYEVKRIVTLYEVKRKVNDINTQTGCIDSLKWRRKI